jgi:hypothetical protein
MREDDSQSLSRQSHTGGVIARMVTATLSLEAWAANWGRALGAIYLLSFLST